MKKLIAILIIFCLICGLLIGGLVKIILEFNQQNQLADSKEQFKLPEITLTTLSGTDIKFDTLQEPTILFFWLPQSHTCQLQISILSEISHNYNLKIIGIGIGDIAASQIKQIKQKKEINFPLIIDSKTDLTQELNVTTIPTLIFYQPTNPPKTITGFQSKTQLKNLIANYFSLN